MSVLAAVVGGDADVRVGRVLDASHRRGDGPTRIVEHRDLAVGVRLGLTSGSLHTDTDLTVIVDGWIDDIVGCSPSTNEAGGAEWVASAFRLLGPDAFRRLRGDHVVIVLDRTRSALFAVRDRAGAKPCYLADTRDGLVLGSQIAMLRADEHVRAEPDEAMIAELLSGSFANSRGTLLRDVTRLPPAALLKVGDGRVTTDVLWNPDDVVAATGDPGCGRDHWRSQIAEARNVLDRAVQKRLGDQPVALELSGGLDSSSVVGTVAALRPSTAERRSMVTASLRSPAGSNGDEWEHICAVQRATAFRSVVAAPSPVTRDELEEQVQTTGYLPPTPNGHMWNDLKQALTVEGIHTTLSGTGGDEWFQRSQLWPSERFLAADLVGARSALDMVGARSAVGLADVLLRPVVRETTRWRRRVPPWVSAELARRTDLAERLAAAPIVPRRTARGDRARVARSAWGSLAFEGLDRHNSLFAMETRHPLWDEDLVEFALRLPESARWQTTHPRGFQSAAFADRLPPSIAARLDKAHFGDLSMQAIDSLGGWDAVASGPCARQGWVDLDVLQPIHQRLVATHAETGQTPGLKPLWNLMSLDLWLATL